MAAEYKVEKATVRIHGEADREKVREATKRYVQKITREEKVRDRRRKTPGAL